MHVSTRAKRGRVILGLCVGVVDSNVRDEQGRVGVHARIACLASVSLTIVWYVSRACICLPLHIPCLILAACIPLVSTHLRIAFTLTISFIAERRSLNSTGLSGSNAPAAMDVFHRLPYEAQKLIIRFTPHPVVHHLYKSEKFVHLWALSQGWYEDWKDRRDRLLRDGLPVRVLGARIESDFFAVYLDADERYLLRSHKKRDFELHITIGYASDFQEGDAVAAAARINEKWAGYDYTLWISWVGSGGAVFLHKKDHIANDPDIVWFHSRGWYRDRQLHVSL